ncbi:MAG: YnbE family lipoprotein [Gammaproteobacteria bacterium]|nr:YnbE family lipoprotein [Gammaproteobacteria bacterium]
MLANLNHSLQRILLSAIVLTFVAACAPTIKVQAPDEPITINLNVKIEHEIRVKVEKDIDDLFSEEGGLF